MANDRPATPGDSLHISAVSSPQHATVSLTPEGNVNFASDTGFVGAASFVYTAAEQSGAMANGQVQVNVAAPAPPTAGNDTVFLPQDHTTLVSSQILLANDTASVPNDVLHLAAVSSGSNGTASLTNGQASFMPSAHFTGAASFGYTVADQFGSTAAANVAVNVTPFVQPVSVTAAKTEFSTAFDAPLSVNAGELTSLTGTGAYSTNWAPNGSTVVPMISTVGNASHGTVSFDPASGQMVFTPDHGFAGTAGFQWQLNSPGAPSAAVQVDVAPPPPPTAVADSLTGTQNMSMVIPASELLANDQKSVPSDDPLHLAAVSAAQHATVSLTTDGNVNFTPDPGFAGVSTFNYTVADQFGQSATANVAVSIPTTTSTSSPPPPVAQPVQETQTIQQMQQVQITQVQQVSTTPVVVVEQPPTVPSVSPTPAPAPLIYFNGTSQAHGSELWSFNGQTIGEVADINPGQPSSFPAELQSIGNSLYFSADDGTHGREPWIFDGQKATMLADINPGSGSSDPRDFVQVVTPPPAGSTSPANASVYFSADDGSHGRELWVANQTGAVSMVADINPGPAGSNPADLTALNGTLYFSANDGSHGAELWKVGTNGNAQQVADINPGAGSSLPDDLTVVGNTLYFIANDGTHGRELFSLPSNGQLVEQQINPGTTGAFPAPGSDSALISAGNKLYFVANVPGQGNMLWSENPGDSAPHVVGSLGGGANAGLTSVQSVAAGHDLYFAVTDAQGNSQLARYDTSTGVLTANIAPDTQDFPSDLTAVGNRVFFTVQNHTSLADVQFRDLYTDNGQATQRIELGSLQTLPHNLQAAGGQLFFADHGQIEQINPQAALTPTTLTVAGGQIYVPIDITAAPNEATPLG